MLPPGLGDLESPDNQKSKVEKLEWENSLYFVS